MKKRIGFIDAMRGMTMFLVVVAHIMTFGLGINAEKSILGSILITFRMPAFFFISGFVAYKSLEHWTKSSYLKTLKNKFLILLIPTMIFFVLLYILKGQNPISLFLVSGFKEYWFMIVLLEIFLIYLTLNFVCHTLKLSERVVDIGLCLIVILGWYLYFNEFYYINSGVRRVFSIGKLVNYFQYFALGVLFRKYWQRVYEFFKKDLFSTIIIVLFIVSMIAIWQVRWTSGNILLYKILHDVVVRYLGFGVYFLIFMYSEKYFDSDKGFSHTLKFIGERTMDIYLIHYFFLPQMGMNKEFASTMFGFFETNNNIVLEIVVVTIMSSLVMAVALGVGCILRKNKFLAHYLFGVKQIKQ